MMKNRCFHISLWSTLIGLAVQWTRFCCAGVLVIAVCFPGALYGQKPTITNFNPKSGPVGITVIITGTNFSATPENNVVYFGATRATVTSATTTQLQVTVPIGATYQPITVMTAGLTAYSNAPFIVTYTRDGSGIGPTTFASSIDLQLPLGILTMGTAIGDLDGDGKPDVVAANETGGKCSVFRNTTSGAINFAANVDFGAGTPTQVIVTDIDGDSKPDLVALDYLGNHGVVILRNTSSGPGSISFATAVTFVVGTNPRSISIGDVDGDGKTDIAAANTNSNNVSLLRNTSSVGTISFSAHVDFTTGTSPQSTWMTDIDGDGKVDLAVANGGSSSISVFRNTSTSGSISYSAKADFSVSGSPYSVRAGDLDGDGKQDLAVANWIGDVVSVLRNNSSGAGSIAFATSVDFASGVQPISISIGDIDGDGKPDLATSDYASNSISVFWNTSTGSGSISFATAVSIPSDSEPFSVSIGDLDGDNKAELVSANGATCTISLFRNLIKVPPSITSISPLSGPVGTSVTISGTNFELTPGNNIVYFGATRATVTAASMTSITALVPLGATCEHVSVLVNDLIAYSPKPFAVTFYSGVSAFGAGSFAAKVAFTSGAGSRAEANGDMDGDGKVDKVVVNATGNSVSILRNTGTGSGSVSFAQKVSFPTGVQPEAVGLGDLDGDGKLDIAVGNNITTTVSVFRNSSTGPGSISLDPKLDIPAGQSQGVAIRDVNKDGRADLVVAYTNGNVAVLKNIGTSTGTISLAPAVTFAVGGFPNGLGVADLDGDGLPDIAVPTASGNTVAVLKNTSSTAAISFGTHVDFTANNAQSIAIGDVDLDGNPDLVAGNLGFGSGNTLSIFRNTGVTGAITSASFAPKVDFTTGTGPASVSIGDLNGDSKPDLVTGNFNGSSVSVLINTSSPGTISITSFAPKVDFTTAATSFSTSLADIDGDGKLDISATSYSQNNIMMLRRQIVPVTPVTTPATLIGQTVFTATWSASAGVTTGYYIDVSTSDTFGTTVTGYTNLFVGNQLSFTVNTNLSPNTTYYYRVRGADGLLVSSNSNTSSVTTLLNPVAVTATQIGPTSFSANWNAVVGAASYFLDVATDEGFVTLTSSNINAGAALTFLISSLEPGTTYYFRVRAHNASGDSPNSNIVSVKTLSTLPSLQAYGITFSAVTNSAVTLNFTPGNGATRLTVVNVNTPLGTVPSSATTYVPNNNYGEGSPVGTGFVVGNGIGTSITVTGLSPATVYYFQTYEFNGSGGSENYLTTTNSTNPVSQVTLANAPAGQATGLTFSYATATSVTVSFKNASDNPDGYVVIRTPGAQSSFVPSNAVAYSVGFRTGTSTVAYVGSSLSFSDSGLPTDTKYYYSIFSYNGAGLSSSYQTNNPLQGSVTLDTSAPLILPPPTPNPKTINTGNSPAFNAVITDNVGIDTAKIFYRGISEREFKSAILSPSGITNVYGVQIQSSWYDAFGLEYYFWAVDGNGNQSSSPTSTSIAQLVNSSLGVPPLPAGTEQGSYRIVSFPYQLSTDNKVTTVYPGVPWNDNTKAALWWWDPTLKGNFNGGYIQYGVDADFQIVEPGKGYWMLVSTPASPQLTNVLAPRYNHSNLYSMTLKPKWNQIGNPYPVAISWDDVIALNSELNPGALFSALSVYDGTGYKQVGPGALLNAFQGGFVKNLGTSDITIQIPFPGQKTNGGRVASIGADIMTDAWRVFLHINQNGFTNELGGFGMDPSAKPGPDWFDNYNPPRFLHVPEVNFINTESPGVIYSNDIVKTGENYTWQFTPSGTVGVQASLNWNSEISTQSKQLFLLDEELIKVIDMGAVSQYDFTITEKSRFRIFYGADVLKKITTQSIVASEPYPNPLTSNDAMKINMALPDGTDNYQVLLQVYNGQGALIETFSRCLTTGLHQLEFAPSNEQFLASGIYVYRLTVISGNASKSFSGKISKL